MPVNSETISQFTTLLDKNGEKIWEGDLVYSDGGPGSRQAIYKVVYWNGCAMIEDMEDKNKEDIDLNADYLWNHHLGITVIGNIHDLTTIKIEDNGK